jgi:hypothetical protein
MPFSASTCLTYTGTTTLIDPIDIFSDSNSYLIPFTSVTLSQITSGNCPLVLTGIPDGTTTIRLKSRNNYCCDIELTCNDLCTTCDLGFTNYSSATINELSCGLLTGDCQNNITDYSIHWYGPDSTTTLAIISGSGTTFDYTYKHPLSGLTSVPLENGVYTPVIQNIIINGLSYSNTGGTGNILFDGTNCIAPINILPLSCGTRTNTVPNYPFSYYQNLIDYNSDNDGPPTTFKSIYKVSSTTKYIAWRFQGEIKPDTLKLSFSGSSYGGTIIGLEEVTVGTPQGITFTTNFNPSIFPKSANTLQYLTKLTCLTGLTVNDNDNIIIEVTPSESNTKYTLFITCVEDYDCNDCISTNEYKIIASSITGITNNDCNTLIVKYDLTGCNGNPDDKDSYLTYYTNDFPSSSTFSQNTNRPTDLVTRNNTTTITGVTTSSMFYSGSGIVRCETQPVFQTSVCTTGSTPTKYDKTFLLDGKGVFGFTGSSTFISTYYNAIVNAFSGGSPFNTVPPISTDPTDLGYYRYFALTIPSSGSSLSCGDQATKIEIDLHHTSDYITGTTGSQFFLKITANTITNQYSGTECGINCLDRTNTKVNEVNSWSTGATTVFGTNREFSTGLYYTNPIQLRYVNSYDEPNTTVRQQGFFNTPDWSFNTYPFSGTPSQIIPSFSATVCNYMSTGIRVPVHNSFTVYQYRFYYEVRRTNPSNPSDFDIWSSPITNFRYSGYTNNINDEPSFELAYRYSGGNVVFSSSTYII